LINKFDLNLDITEKIEDYCRQAAIQVVGKIPFDENIVRAMVEGKTIPEYANDEMKSRLQDIWDTVSADF
jgi:MinD superfamily P-loop ATPase